MAQIIRREVRKRGFFGKVFKFFFIIFNILMVIWLVSYWVQIGSTLNATSSEAVRTGTSIGVTLGSTFIIFFWAAGSIILGLLTMMSRGQKIIVEESRDE